MAADDAAALLELSGVVAGYAEVEVLRGVSLAVRAGEIVCIIGSNGAGKSTLLRTVFGMVQARAGTIRFGGEDIANRPPTEVLKRGIGYVPQGRCNFPAMSVEENLEMGAYLRRDARVRGDIEALFVRFPMLAAKRGDPAGTLSGAPKIRAMQLIAAAEGERRGLYGGAVGYLGYDGNLDTAITIRSAILKDGQAHVHTGAGIVAGSVPEREFEETEHKAAALRRAIEMAAGIQETPRPEPGEPTEANR